jgi:hypothetical protein
MEDKTSGNILESMSVWRRREIKARNKEDGD